MNLRKERLVAMIELTQKVKLALVALVKIRLLVLNGECGRKVKL